jgi:hypothetical protein
MVRKGSSVRVRQRALEDGCWLRGICRQLIQRTSRLRRRWKLFGKPLRQRVVLLVDGLCLEDGMVVVLQVLDVRAISLEPDSSTPAERRWKLVRPASRRSRRPCSRPDEARGTVLGQDVSWFAIEGHKPTDLGRPRGGLSCVGAGYRDDRLHGKHSPAGRPAGDSLVANLIAGRGGLSDAKRSQRDARFPRDPGLRSARGGGCASPCESRARVPSG